MNPDASKKRRSNNVDTTSPEYLAKANELYAAALRYQAALDALEEGERQARIEKNAR